MKAGQGLLGHSTPMMTVHYIPADPHAMRAAVPCRGRAASWASAGPARRKARNQPEVGLARRRVSLAGTEVGLTPTEYRLLAVLVRHAGKVFTHRQFLQEVWGAPRLHDPAPHKLEADPTRPKRLVTEPGVGYRLNTE